MRKGRVPGHVNWATYRLDQIATRITRRNTVGNTNILTVSARDGLIGQDEFFRRRVASSDTRLYSLLEPGDFVYSKSYSDGYPVGVVKSLRGAVPGIVSPLYICFKPDASVVDDRYLEYYFDAGMADGEIEWIAKEGSRNHGLLNVGIDDFMSIGLCLPPVEEQRRIVKILDAADEVIRFSAAVLAKLSLRQAGMLRTLLAESAAPESRLINFLSGQPRNGFSPNEAESWTGVAVLGLGCLTAGGFSPRQIKNVSPRDSRYSGSWLSDGDLLISRSNTFELVGLVGRYRDIGVPCLYPDLMMKLTPKPTVRPQFLEIALRDPLMRSQIQAIAQGTSGSMVKISGSAVANLKIRIPETAEQDRILGIINAATEEKASREQEVVKLLVLRQGLMDDLLTGRVRVTSVSL
jgi:type I restriction enzyme S subunit